MLIEAQKHSPNWVEKTSNALSAAVAGVSSSIIKPPRPPHLPPHRSKFPSQPFQSHLSIFLPPVMAKNRATLRPVASATLFLSCIVSVRAILDPVDFLALQSTRRSLWDMPSSSFFSSWDFTSDPCSFAGVYCDRDRVFTLNVGGPRAGAPGLTGSID